SNIDAIELTDSGTPTLTLTVAQVSADSDALSKITNPDYAIAVSDTAADVSPSIDALNDDTRVGSITLTDAGTPTLSLTSAQALEDTNALGRINNVNVIVSITDTADNVASDLDALNGDSQIGAITLSDSGAPTLSLSVAQALGDSTALNKITNNDYSIAVS